jgi:HEAT repeat protein
MTPMAVFVRTLLKTSAIFIGTTVVFLHPPLDWSPARTLTAQQTPTEAAVDALVLALRDSDRHVRRTTAASLARLAHPRSLRALIAASNDPDPVVRQHASRVVTNIKASLAAPVSRSR